MKEKRIFSIAEEHKPIVGCTTSEALLQGSMCSMSVFSIAAETNISPETYNYPKLWKIESTLSRCSTASCLWCRKIFRSAYKAAADVYIRKSYSIRSVL